MKKILYSLFFTFIIFTACPMESPLKELTPNDKIKMEKSAHYSDQVIKIMQTHLEIVKSELVQRNIPESKKNFLTQSLAVTTNAVALINDSPIYTYLILQSSNKLFNKTHSTLSIASVKSDIYFCSMQDYFKNLGSLYTKITQEAYEEISTLYSIETLLILNKLLEHDNSALQRKSMLTEETYEKSQKESKDILQMLDQIIISPSQTYSILSAFNEENKRIPYEILQNRSSDPETHFIQDRYLLVGELSELYEKIIQ